MILDRVLPRYDVSERHARTLGVSLDVAWRALWSADLAGGAVVRLLMGLRALPAALLGPDTLRRTPRRVRLEELIAFGFGKLAEEPGREVVLGIEGRFWRPLGNLDPFDRTSFERPVEPGRARAAWSFALEPAGVGRTRLTTETRVLCGDPRSRRKFKLYWLLVRPGSGWIRRAILASVAREAGRQSRFRHS